MEQKRSKLTKKDLKVGDKVQVICKACDFYLFSGTETGTVARIIDGDYLCIIVEFDEPMIYEALGGNGTWTKKDHNFHPYDLVLLDKRQDEIWGPPEFNPEMDAAVKTLRKCMRETQEALDAVMKIINLFEEGYPWK